ncbi:MAG: ABC transporter ATP-binding protein, partial [Myxococcales bacterium]|nr:ABC transporter ATP-binding protein [Myxococcales bacterium]
LRDATFTVPQGSVFGLVGPNGAGKTTTLKILMGLIKASGGTASINGTSVPDVKSRKNMGFLPETPHFYDHLKPQEFLGFVGQLYGMTSAQCTKRSDELLERVGLSEAKKKPIRKFSKGMMQRVGIAQALMHDPDLVILDEPQSGLDPIGRKEVKDLIIEQKERGKTVFFSSHILADVEDVCDEIAVMIRGRVIDCGRVDELLSPKLLETELEVSGAPPAVLDEITAEAHRTVKTKDSLAMWFTGDHDVAPYIRQVVEAGGKVIRLVPHREHLEDLFVREATREPSKENE